MDNRSHNLSPLASNTLGLRYAISFKQAAESLLNEINPIAALLDNAHGKSATEYGIACQSILQQAMLESQIKHRLQG